MTGGAAPAFPRRPLAPLALTLGLHLLLVLAWMRGAAPLVQRAPDERASTFVQVLPPLAAQPRPKPAAPPRGAEPRSRARLPVPVDEPAHVRAHAPAHVPVTVATQAPVPVAAPDPEPPGASAPTAAPAPPGDLLATSKRMAGGVDRALRNGASPISAEPERKWERFTAAFEAARTGVAPGTILESYTSGDGVTVYRKTVGHRVACYRSGSVGGLGPADGRSAGNIPCPTGATWTRH